MKRGAFFLCLLMVELTGLTASHAQTLLQDSTFYQKSWGVVIGISNYENDGIPDLQYAVNDALAIKARFEKMGFEVATLLDKQATRENILQLLSVDLPRELGRGDRLVIFYAGHGATGQMPEGNEVGFIVPHDAIPSANIVGGTIQIDRYDQFVQETNFVSLEDLRHLSDSISAKHVFYIIDGCYSGFLDPAVYNYRPALRDKRNDETMEVASGKRRSLNVETVEGSDEQIAPDAKAARTALAEELRLTERDAVQVMTAGRSGEPVTELSGHGIFTYYLLRGLDGEADTNGDYIIRATELADYVKNVVPEASEFTQTPLFNRVSGEGEMIFIPPLAQPISARHTRQPVADDAWKNTDAYQAKSLKGYKSPTQIVLDGQQNLYVLDEKLQKIFKFDAQGTFVPDRFELAEEGGWSPSSMAARPNGDVWVFFASSKKQKTPGKIVAYRPDGSVGEHWAGSDPVDSCSFGEKPFPSRALIATDPTENLFLVSPESQHIMKCDRSGELIAEWNAPGEYARFSGAQGVAVDPLGYLYITDTNGNGIQKFFNAEWLKTRWPRIKGEKPTYFNAPRGIAVDGDLIVYVADAGNHRIKKYTNDGNKLLVSWGKKGKKMNEFDEPSGIAVSADGTVAYIADTGNKRILRFVIK